MSTSVNWHFFLQNPDVSSSHDYELQWTNSLCSRSMTTIIIWWPNGLCCFYELFKVSHGRLSTEFLNVCKVALNICLRLCTCCSFRRDVDATRSRFLSKNKCNYLQHHFVHNYTNSAYAIKIMEYAWENYSQIIISLPQYRTESP